MPLTIRSMELLSEKEWDEHTIKVEIDSVSGQRTYTSIYPVKIPKGLVEVEFSPSYSAPRYMHPITPESVHIVLNRHTAQNIIIAAKLDKEEAQRCDLTKVQPDYKKYNSVWKPWLDDKIIKTDCATKTLAKLEELIVYLLRLLFLGITILQFQLTLMQK